MPKLTMVNRHNKSMGATGRGIFLGLCLVAILMMPSQPVDAGLKHKHDPGYRQGKTETGFIYSSGNTDKGIIYFDSPNYFLLVGNKKYSISPPPSTSPMSKMRLPIVWQGDRFLVAGLRSGVGLVVSEYERQKGKHLYDYEIVHEEVIATDSCYPRVSNMKQVGDSIVLAWYKEISGTTKSFPCFSFYNGSWETTELEWDNSSAGMPWVSADFATMPNGDIWYFGHHDSNKNIALIVLREKELVYIDTKWSDKYDSDFSCEGENPYIVAESCDDGIILAYQSRDYKFFSVDPFLKGARINVVKVHPDGNKQMLYQTNGYSERVTPFALIGTSILYAPITEEDNGWIQNRIYRVDESGHATFISENHQPTLFLCQDNFYYHNSPDGEIRNNSILE